MRKVTLIAAVMLAACQQGGFGPPADDRSPAPAPAANPAPTSSPAASSPAAPTEVTTLEGEWRVAGIDGADFNESYGLALRGSARELWWEPRCAGMARSYRVAGNAIAFGPPVDVDPPPGPGVPARPVCTIGLPPRLADVFRALDAATSVERTEANGVLIAGGGRSVLLFSQ